MTELPRIAAFSLRVPDYDEAISWYTGALGFGLLEDTPLVPGKRWVRVAPRGGGCALLLARAATPEQRAAIGRQGGGRVWLFLHTDDFDRDHARMQAHGVRFLEPPGRSPTAGWRYSRIRTATAGTCCNRLIERNPQTQDRACPRRMVEQRWASHFRTHAGLAKPRYILSPSPDASDTDALRRNPTRDVGRTRGAIYPSQPQGSSWRGRR